MKRRMYVAVVMSLPCSRSKNSSQGMEVRTERAERTIRTVPDEVEVPIHRNLGLNIDIQALQIRLHESHQPRKTFPSMQRIPSRPLRRFAIDHLVHRHLFVLVFDRSGRLRRGAAGTVDGPTGAGRVPRSGGRVVSPGRRGRYGLGAAVGRGTALVLMFPQKVVQHVSGRLVKHLLPEPKLSRPAGVPLLRPRHVLVHFGDGEVKVEAEGEDGPRQEDDEDGVGRVFEIGQLDFHAPELDPPADLAVRGWRLEADRLPVRRLNILWDEAASGQLRHSRAAQVGWDPPRSGRFRPHRPDPASRKR